MTCTPMIRAKVSPFSEEYATIPANTNEATKAIRSNSLAKCFNNCRLLGIIVRLIERDCWLNTTRYSMDRSALISVLDAEWARH